MFESEEAVDILMMAQCGLVLLMLITFGILIRMIHQAAQDEQHEKQMFKMQPSPVTLNPVQPPDSPPDVQMDEKITFERSHSTLDDHTPLEKSRSSLSDIDNAIFGLMERAHSTLSEAPVADYTRCRASSSVYSNQCGSDGIYELEKVDSILSNGSVVELREMRRRTSGTDLNNGMVGELDSNGMVQVARTHSSLSDYGVGAGGGQKDVKRAKTDLEIDL